MSSVSVLLAHATPCRRLKSIFAFGLSPAFARGKQRVVWLHSPARSAWALPHVAARHQVAAADTVLIRVRVPRSWLRRRGRGLWACARVIPAARFVCIRPAAACIR